MDETFTWAMLHIQFVMAALWSIAVFTWIIIGILLGKET